MLAVRGEGPAVREAPESAPRSDIREATVRHQSPAARPCPSASVGPRLEAIRPRPLPSHPPARAHLRPSWVLPFLWFPYASRRRTMGRTPPRNPYFIGITC